jgi:hypothetical protein
VAALLSVISLGVWLGGLARTGLALEIRAQDGRVLASYPYANLGTSRTDAWLAGGSGPLHAAWTGYWIVPDPGFRELVLKSDGQALVHLDGVPVLLTGADGATGNRSTAFVAPGAHRLGVLYSPGSGTTHEIFVKGVTAKGRSIAIERRATSSSWPGSRHGRLDVLARRVLPGCSLLAWVGVLLGRIRSGASWRLRETGPLALSCLALIVAGSLRFEALVTRYWGVAAPDLAVALGSEIRSFRPGTFEHTPNPHPYEGDPFSYLTIAKSMGSFYDPSAREPLFPALTRIALSLAGGRDIGINFLSGLCSALVCLGIFALGRSLGSGWAGAAAALLWAIEWQCISFSVEGRDDLFSLQVALCTAGLVSLHLKPDRRGATLLGLAAGLTLLTRLSALTFLIPCLAAAVILPSPPPRGDRLRASAVVIFWMLLLAGPFMAACAFGYGDPFYAVNVHAAFYRRRAGLQGAGADSALSFLLQSRLPWEFVETGFRGLTTVPFLNKWAGLGALLPGLGSVVRTLALAGLPVLLWRPGGALALLALGLSIVPYAWTWDIPGGGEWRFTLPAYAFYLLGAMLALQAAATGLLGAARAACRKETLRAGLRVVSTAIVLAASGLWTSRTLDWLRVKEAIRNGRSALIEVGPRAGRFFTSGWTFMGREDGSEAMEMNGPRARLRVPAARGRPLRVVLRLGAGGKASSSVTVLAGAQSLARLTGPWGRGQVVVLQIPRGSGATAADIELDFRATNGTSDATPLALLWVRVEPEVAEGP